MPPIAGSAFESGRLVEWRSVASDRPSGDTQAALSVILGQNQGDRLQTPKFTEEDEPADEILHTEYND